MYDTVTNLSWTVDFRRHGIANVIENILTDPWAPSVEIGREVPEAMAQVDCVVCYNFLLSFQILINPRSATVGSSETFQKLEHFVIKMGLFILFQLHRPVLFYSIIYHINISLVLNLILLFLAFRR